MQTELFGLLQSNPIANLPVLGFFANYPVENHFMHNNSLILTGTSDYTWAYLSITNPNDLGVLIEKLGFETLYFANVEEWMIPVITKNHRIEWKLFTSRYYLPDDTIVEPGEKESHPLDKSQIGFIFQNSTYKDFTSEKYIAERLERDVSAGIWVNGQLAGWGLTHDDGSLGFLNVLSEFRGQGIGEGIFRSLITAKRAQNKPVFVNVEPHNKQSISLLEKLGMEYDRPVSWIKLT